MIEGKNNALGICIISIKPELNQKKIMAKKKYSREIILKKFSLAYYNRCGWHQIQLIKYFLMLRK